MKHLFYLLLILCCGVARAQTDSLEVKLQQYKNLYAKGLISADEYEVLKGKLLNLETPGNGYNPADTLFFRKQTANIRLIPCGYGNLAVTENDVAGSGTTNFNDRIYTLGLHLQVGPNIKKRYAPNVGIGFEISNRRLLVPVYADFNMNILKGKFSPYFHAGGGFMVLRNLNSSDRTTHPCGQALFGFGFHANVDNRFSIAFSPDYRFIYYSGRNDFPLKLNVKSIIHNYLHQFGVRLQFIFY